MNASVVIEVMNAVENLVVKASTEYLLFPQNEVTYNIFLGESYFSFYIFGIFCKIFSLVNISTVSLCYSSSEGYFNTAKGEGLKAVTWLLEVSKWQKCTTEGIYMFLHRTCTFNVQFTLFSALGKCHLLWEGGLQNLC